MTITINPLVFGFIVGIIFTFAIEIIIGVIITNKQNKR